MAIDRATLYEGPAIVQMGGETFYSKDDVKVDVYFETNPINSSAYGKVDERVKNIEAKISFTPVGQWTSGALAILYPHTNPSTGASLLGASDVPVTVHPLNGKEKIVFTAGCVTKMPDLDLNSMDAPFGEMEISCGLKNSGARSAADALYTLTATASFTDTSFDAAEIPTPFYTCGWGSTPFDSFVAEKGVKVKFAMKTTPREISGYGVVDWRLAGLDVSVLLSPVGLTAAQVLARIKLQNTGAAIGVSLAANGSDLTIVGSGTGSPTITVKGAALRKVPQLYGQTVPRHGELEFIATRATGGTLFSVGVTV